MQLLLGGHTKETDEWVEEWFEVDGFTETELEELLENFYDDNEVDEVNIEDSEGFFQYSENLVSSRIVDLEELAEVIEKIEVHGEAFTVFAENNSREEWKNFEEAFRGEFDSITDFAQEFISECYELAESLHPYFDFEGFGEDLVSDGCYSSVESETGTVFIFTDY
jgi:antirestriction protein